jgi:drug/metabolite transporter (DMT)-like permease
MSLTGTRWSGALLVASGAAIWGLWALFVRPAHLTGAQTGFTVLVVYSLAIPFCLRREAFRDRGAVLALGVVGISDACGLALYFSAISRGPVAVAVLTHYLAPVLVALFAPLVARERRSLRALHAVPLSLIGLALLLGRPRSGFPLETALEGAGSAIFYAAMVFGAQRAGRSFSPLAISAWHGPVSLAVLLALFGRGAIPLQASAASLGWLLAGAAICGLLACGLFYAGLARVPAQVAGPLTYFEPLFASAVGFVAFGERLSPLALVGAAVIVAAGVYVVMEPKGGAARSVSTAS